RKEYKKRGKGYWYAYTRVEGKLTKHYLGRSTNLTIAHLEQVAQELWLDPQVAPQHKEDGASSAIVQLSSAPLLTAKLLVPRLSSHAVARPHLLERLDKSMEQALTLISAPTGFGKSTLLAMWLASRALPVAWL